MKLHAQEFILEGGEEIIAEVRKHWLVLFLEVLPYVLLAVAPILIPKILALFPAMSPDFIASLANTESSARHFILGVWWLFLWMGGFKAFTDYYLDAWFITTHRVVNIEQHGFFDREVSSVFLNRVQDATTEIVGIIPTLLDFGDIQIQSAGAVDHFVIEGVPHPRELRDRILSEARKNTPVSI